MVREGRRLQFLPQELAHHQRLAEGYYTYCEEN
jgi:hypothetical protein